MTLSECYNNFGGNYNDVVTRLRNEQIIQKFVLRFLDDESYNNLVHAINERNFKDAFIAAHTLKGLCQNLAFDNLAKSASCLTEALRHEDYSNLDELINKVNLDYNTVADTIKQFKESAI